MLRVLSKLVDFEPLITITAANDLRSVDATGTVTVANANGFVRSGDAAKS